MTPVTSSITIIAITMNMMTVAITQRTTINKIPANAAIATATGAVHKLCTQPPHLSHRDANSSPANTFTTVDASSSNEHVHARMCVHASIHASICRIRHLLLTPPLGVRTPSDTPPFKDFRTNL